VQRRGKYARTTQETQVEIEIALDGKGEFQGSSGIPFLDHMLALFARHGLLDLELKAQGDIQVDFHHLVEDIGICLGEALSQAWGNKEGMKRYGFTILPMDEVLVLLSMDISNRAYLYFNVPLKNDKKIGTFDLEIAKEFFRSLVAHAGITLHIHLFWGENFHHVLEAIFKALGKALDEATSIDSRIKGVLSTKGQL